MLSRLETGFCPGFPTGIASPGQKGGPFSPESVNRDETWLRATSARPLVPVGNTNRDQWPCRCGTQPRFVPVGVTNGTKGPPFFLYFVSFGLFYFYFNCTFALELNGSMNSTNILIYIDIHLCYICPLYVSYI